MICRLAGSVLLQCTVKVIHNITIYSITHTLLHNNVCHYTYITTLPCIALLLRYYATLHLYNMPYITLHIHYYTEQSCTYIVTQNYIPLRLHHLHYTIQHALTILHYRAITLTTSYCIALHMHQCATLNSITLYYYTLQYYTYITRLHCIAELHYIVQHFSYVTTLHSIVLYLHYYITLYTRVYEKS